MVCARVIHHGLGQPPLVSQPEVTLCPQFGHRMLGKKIRAYSPHGGLSCHRFRTVLAKLKGRRMVTVGPGTARAVKPVRLIGRQQGLGPLERNILVQQGVLDTIQSTPATGGAFVKLNLFLFHRRLLQHRKIQGRHGMFMPKALSRSLRALYCVTTWSKASVQKCNTEAAGHLRRFGITTPALGGHWKNFAALSNVL